jgi:hypothetical protein
MQWMLRTWIRGWGCGGGCTKGRLHNSVPRRDKYKLYAMTDSAYQGTTGQLVGSLMMGRLRICSKIHESKNREHTADIK